VVIAGRPNVGKSILLNRLAGTELAIVTAIPGTTRDAIRGAVNISGVPIHLVDTAGLREPRDEIEKIGISRACVEIAEADVVFWVADITRPETRSLEDSVISSIPEQAAQIRIINKIDLVAEPVAAPDIGVSAKTGQGIDLLRAALLDAAGWSGSEGIYLARERHLHSLQLAATHLGRAAAHGSPQIELVAEELRLAHMALAAITGEFTADDLLGKIFSSFCIGK
jgi:tRNA modification GTPase